MSGKEEAVEARLRGRATVLTCSACRFGAHVRALNNVMKNEFRPPPVHRALSDRLAIGEALEDDMRWAQWAGLLIGSAAVMWASVVNAGETTPLQALLDRGYEIKAEIVKSNLVLTTLQKGSKAFICASSSDLVGRVLMGKTVKDSCVPFS
jgi:hypothetical protein